MNNGKKTLQQLEQELQATRQELRKAQQQLNTMKKMQPPPPQSQAPDNNDYQLAYEQMKALVSNLQMGILVESADRRVIQTNQWFCDLFGIPSPEAITGVNCDDAARAAAPHFKDQQGFLETIQEHLRNGKIVTNEEVELQDGRTFKRDYVPVYDGEAFVGNMWLYRDITQRKKNEETLRKNAEELYELNVTKDKFFTIIAHDLRNPFTSILGFSRLLEENMQDKDYESAAEFSHIIHTSASRAMNLLQNLLTWARTQTGKIEYNPAQLNLSALLDEIIDIYEEDFKNKKLDIEKEAPPSLYLEGDEDMLKTVFRNLISNAVKFSYEHGRIAVKAIENEKEVNILVSDRGKGIPPKDVKRLFKLDESFSTEGTKKEQGTGLGLLLCKEFVDHHQGTIIAESTPGEGTTFRVSLPK